MRKLCLLLILFLLSTGKIFALTPIMGFGTICAGDNTVLSNATSGGTWSSSNTAVATIGSLTGIVGGVSAGIDTITYTVGVNSVTFVMTINPLPVFTSSSTPPAVCDSTIFNYTPMSSTTGTTFAWSRGFNPGIANAASSGTGNPNETLFNTTPNQVVVTYAYVLSSAGCLSSQSVYVKSNPTPKLSSATTGLTVCDSDVFSYTPASLTAAATFTWVRPAVAGISNTPAGGTGNPNESLYNITTSPIVVTYFYRLSAYGCTNSGTESVNVTVEPCWLGVNNFSTARGALTMYPNPSSGALTVELTTSNAHSTITIIDMTGKTIVTGTIPAHGVKNKISFNDIPPGTYVIKVSSGNEIHREKLVVW